MDTAQWPQEAPLVRPMDAGTAVSMGGRAAVTMPAISERRIRRQNEQPLNCPRCNSNNTKFCYYNNYSLTQPRYFCKTCRRYWTEGGSLRNIPVGGGSRKNKRSASSSAPATATTSSSTTPPSNTNISVTSSMQNPKFSEGQDLNLAFANISGLPEIDSFSNMELLRGGGMSERHPSTTFMHEIYGAGFGLQDIRGGALGLGFQVGAGGADHDEGRLLFTSTAHDAQLNQNRGQGGATPGFWNAMMGGAGGTW